MTGASLDLTLLAGSNYGQQCPPHCELVIVVESVADPWYIMRGTFVIEAVC